MGGRGQKRNQVCVRVFWFDGLTDDLLFPGYDDVGVVSVGACDSEVFLETTSADAAESATGAAVTVTAAAEVGKKGSTP